MLAIQRFKMNLLIFGVTTTSRNGIACCVIQKAAKLSSAVIVNSNFRIVSKPFTQSSGDPHADAAARIAGNKSSERLQAEEALGQLDPTVRIQNVALATILFGFATGVWWYSATAVGGGGESGSGSEMGALKELEDAAAEARLIRAEKQVEDERMRDLLDGDDENEHDFDDEDEFNKSNQQPKTRPLWRRVIFFWK